MRHNDDMTPYRIGLGRDLLKVRIAIRQRDAHGLKCALRWMRESCGRRSYWGLWQAEWTGCQRAVRGLTAKATYRRALRRRGVVRP